MFKKSEYASSETHVIDVVHFVAPIMLNIWSYYRVNNQVLNIFGAVISGYFNSCLIFKIVLGS